MPITATILKVRPIREGGAYGEKGPEVAFAWYVTFSEIIDQGTALYLCANDSLGRFPLPNLVGYGASVCTSLRAEPVRENRRIWRIVADFRTPDNNGNTPQPPNSNTNPIPIGELLAPELIGNDDWIPTLSRYPRQVSYAAQKAFYLGGYSDYADAELILPANKDSDGRVPLVTSAGQRLAGAPDFVFHQAEWLVRYYVQYPDETVFDYEGTTNDAQLSFSLRGLDGTFAKNSARLEGVTVTEVSRGATSRWEISMSILHDRRTLVYEIADRGTMRRAKAGIDNDQFGAPIVSAVASIHMQPIKDPEGRVMTDPVDLNGNGQPSANGYKTFFGRWRNEEERNWSLMPYFSNLIVATP